GPACLADLENRSDGGGKSLPVIHREQPRFAHFDLTAVVDGNGKNLGLVFISIGLDALQRKLEVMATEEQTRLELRSLEGDLLLSAGSESMPETEMVEWMLVPGTPWALVYSVATPPMQKVFFTFAGVTLVTTLVVLLLAVLFTSLGARYISRDLELISDNLVRAAEGLSPRSARTPRLKEIADMTPTLDRIAAQFRRRQKDLLELSFTDELTGLPNRRQLQNSFEQLAGFPARGIRICVCVFDIDHFKQVNDRFGHAVGDHTLLALSEILREAQRASDFVARLAGDEFIAVLVGTEAADILPWIDRIRERFRSTSYPGLADVPAEMRSLSCGFYCPEGPGRETLSAVLEKADVALYQAKEMGRNVAVRYSAEN
ncbi:MAG: GGDEF domain-containing protein, partial [Gammaproteobacteria bacterium]|nr:GGDEF domain-containing protein [Gammaproteobacteria bacterium]